MNKIILLLEESEPLRKSIVFMLSSEGFTVLSAASIDQALELQQDTSVDLLIADLHSCIESGLLLLEPLTGGSTELHFPVIVLHADLFGAYAITNSMSGMVRFITKPFSRNVLLSAVHSFLGSPGHFEECSEL